MTVCCAIRHIYLCVMHNTETHHSGLTWFLRKRGGGEMEGDIKNTAGEGGGEWWRYILGREKGWMDGVGGWG